MTEVGKGLANLRLLMMISARFGCSKGREIGKSVSEPGPGPGVFAWYADSSDLAIDLSSVNV
jgi:hypothetical protein